MESRYPPRWHADGGADLRASRAQTSGAIRSIPSTGPLIVEVELALRLDDDLPVRAEPYTRDEVADAAGEVLIGVEFIHWRFATDEPPPFLAFLVDNLGNAGYVTGDAIRDFRSLDLSRRRCRVSIDAALAHDRIGGHPQGDPFAPVIACLGQGLLGLGGLRAGHFVTTGSLDHAAAGGSGGPSCARSSRASAQSPPAPIER